MPNNQPEKKHYVLRTTPPRPTFQQDMTEEERHIMIQHIAYWTDNADKGIALVFGPVFDPKGGYGLGIIEVENEMQINTLIAEDPAVISGLLRTEFNPMRAILSKKWQAT